MTRLPVLKVKLFGHNVLGECVRVVKCILLRMTFEETEIKTCKELASSTCTAARVLGSRKPIQSKDESGTMTRGASGVCE